MNASSKSYKVRMESMKTTINALHPNRQSSIYNARKQIKFYKRYQKYADIAHLRVKHDII